MVFFKSKKSKKVLILDGLKCNLLYEHFFLKKKKKGHVIEMF